MHASPHLPRLRHLGGKQTGSPWPPLALALGLFVAVFLLRQGDTMAANGEAALFVLPVGVLGLRFGLRGALLGALGTVAFVVTWDVLSGSERLSTMGYVARAVGFVAISAALGAFVDRRGKLEAEIVRYYEGSLDLLATADMNGYFTRVNPAWHRLLGYSEQALCARPFIEFVHPEDREMTIAETQGLVDGGYETVGFRNRYRAADGSYLWLEWSASASLSDGVIHAVARDVTVQHEAEQQLANNAKCLEKLVAERTRELDAARAETLRQLAIAAEYRDDETYQHTERVGHVAAKLALELGLPAGQVTLLRQAAPLHDVGKLAIPDCILLKAGKLTPEEFKVMKTHAALGARLLSSGSSPVLQMAAVIAATHHERWDGGGYPSRLSGETIPLVGRIVAVADVFDALTHDRPYKRAWSVEDAIAEIGRCAGGQFDPRVVTAFLALRDGLAFVLDDLSGAGPPEQSVLSEIPALAYSRSRGELLEHIDRHALRAEVR
jgi:PAS domain S-box-containing protein/putative nucleotidyltransferase with HDIG domain